MKKQMLSEEFKRMQKIAGLITESLNEDITTISKSEFKNMIREMALAEAKKDKEEEGDIEIEDTETVDTEETPTEDTPKGNPDDILDSLKTALNGAKALGDEKLTDQIGNTITFYTRVHIVGQEQVTESAYDYVKTPKEYVALQLSDFFGVPKNKLMSFNLDGTDDIDALTDALNSTSTQGTEMYLKMSLELAKEHFD